MPHQAQHSYVSYTQANRLDHVEQRGIAPYNTHAIFDFCRRVRPQDRPCDVISAPGFRPWAFGSPLGSSRSQDMITRVLASFAIAAVVALMASLPVAGQSASGSAPPLVITAYNGGPPTNYVTPRTPCGEPDLQGTWSSDDTEGIPRERPPALGTQLYQSDQEYAARAKQVEANVANRENNATSTFRNDFARRAFRQTSLLVEAR